MMPSLRLAWAGIVVCGTLIGCSDVAAPRDAVVVTVSGLQGPTLVTDDSGGVALSCNVDLSASTTGGGPYSWLDAVFRFYAGSDTVTALDSVVFPAADVRDSWQKDQVGGGDHLTSHWQFVASIPFTIIITYHYQPVGGGREGSTNVVIACGPSLAKNVAPPQITLLSVHGGPFEPGKPLTLDYGASSSGALWRTTVKVTGACDSSWVFPDSLYQQVQRILSVTLPRSCALGVALRVEVTAEDAGLQSTTRDLATPVSLVDLTAPTLGVLLFPRGSVVGTPDMRGSYFGGDTILMDIFTSDNHTVRSVVWDVEPAGFRDSVITKVADLTYRLRLPVQSAWAGTMQLTILSRDSSGNTQQLASAPNAFRLRPGGTMPGTDFVAVPGDVSDFVFDQKRGVLYLLQHNVMKVAQFSTVTKTITKSVDLPGPAWAFDLTAGGDSLLVTLPLQRALGVIDLRAATWSVAILPLTMDTTVNQYPVQVITSSNGHAFVSTQGNAAAGYRLIDLNLATRAQSVRLDAGNGGLYGGGMSRNADHKVIWAVSGYNQYQLYDPVADVFGAFRTGNISSAPQMSADGSVLTVGDYLYDGALNFLRLVEDGCGCLPATTISPDGLTHYRVISPDGVIRSRVSDGATIDVLRNPILADLIKASPDGHMLVTVAFPNLLSVIPLP